MSKGCPGSGLWSMQRWVQRWDVCWRLNQQASNWVWVGEVDKTEIMCSVFNKLNRVRSQGTGAFPIEPDWWSRKFYLGQHRTLGLHTQGVCFRCSSFSRECTESRRPLACETRGVGEIPGSEQKAWWLEAWEYPTAHLCKSGSWDLKRKKCGAWGSTTVHGGAGLLCFSSIQVNTKVSSVMTSGGPLLLVGMQTSTATMENSVEIPSKTGNRTALWPSNPTARHTHWGNQKGKRHVYPNVHRSTVYNSQDIEAT